MPIALLGDDALKIGICKLTEVISTDASFAVCFLHAVASPARRKKLSSAAAVKSTDRSSGQ
jgi:hypothetical protein